MIVFVPLCFHRDSEVLMKRSGVSSDCLLGMLMCFNRIFCPSSSFHFLHRDLLFSHALPLSHFLTSSSRPFGLHINAKFRFLWLLIKNINLFLSTFPWHVPSRFPSTQIPNLVSCTLLLLQHFPSVTPALSWMVTSVSTRGSLLSPNCWRDDSMTTVASR